MKRRPKDGAEFGGGQPSGADANVLPDLLASRLAIVFCGSAASGASARAGAYYAGPGNRFWPTLFATGLTPRQFRPREFREILKLGIGLTDMAKTVSGVDAALPAGADDAAGLRHKVERYQPAILAFVGKRAGRALLSRPVEYGPQSETVGHTGLFVLPSPSGAAQRWWDENWWHALAALTARAASE